MIIYRIIIANMQKEIIDFKFEDKTSHAEYETEIMTLKSNIACHIQSCQSTPEGLLGFIYHNDTAKFNVFDSNLPFNNTTKTPFKCDVILASENIGTIELIEQDKEKFYNITYKKKFPHTVYVDDELCDNKKYILSTITNDQFHITCELGYKHPIYTQNDPLDRQSDLSDKQSDLSDKQSNSLDKQSDLINKKDISTLFECEFNYSLNSIIVTNELLIYLINNQNITTPDVYMGRATFIDAVKSLILLHLIVLNPSNDVTNVTTSSEEIKKSQTITTTKNYNRLYMIAGGVICMSIGISIGLSAPIVFNKLKRLKWF